jgi:hypothetical protein
VCSQQSSISIISSFRRNWNILSMSHSGLSSGIWWTPMVFSLCCTKCPQSQIMWIPVSSSSPQCLQDTSPSGGFLLCVGWVGGQKVLSRPSADSFAVGRRQKGTGYFPQLFSLIRQRPTANQFPKARQVVFLTRLTRCNLVGTLSSTH